MLYNSTRIFFNALSAFFILGFSICTPRFADAQCPANPIGGTPNLLTSSLPNEVYFCEGVSSVILDPRISNPAINYRWYKYSTTNNLWTDLFITSSSITLSNKNTDIARYAVCWQQGNTGNYSSDEIEVKEKSFLEEVNAAKEFELPNGASQIFTCSNQPVQPFDSPGNSNYAYRWGQPLGFSDVNVKNTTFTLPTNLYSNAAKGNTNTSSFPIPLIITDKVNGCLVQQNITLQIYPFLGPEFANLSDDICQNNPIEDPEVRVFMISGYSIQSATVKVGNDPERTYSGTNFVTNNANSLNPQQNTLGRNDAALTGTTKVQVLKIPLTASQTGVLPVTFTMVTDKGCVGNITKTVTVHPNPVYAVILDPSNQTKTSFCINDKSFGPLKSNPVAAGIFSGRGVTGDETNGYFFDPKIAGDGNFNISFAVKTSNFGTSCGGAIVNVTVRPAPKPILFGKAIVCPGSNNVVYKDAFVLTSGTARTWSIQNSAGLNIGSTTTFVPSGNQINVSFANPFTQADRKAFVVVTNDDAGCIATEKLEVTVNPFRKSRLPIGQTAGCLGSTSTFTYKHGSVDNAGYTYRWKVTGGTKVSSSGFDSSAVDVNWNTAANSGTRTITVTDASTTVGGGKCLIESDPLIVDFLNPPVANIKNIQAQKVCAGDLVSLEVDNPIAGVTYTWTPINKTGNNVNFSIPNPYGSSAATGEYYNYNLKATIPSCPDDIKSQVLNIFPAPPDPIPLDLIENCFAEDKIVSITITSPNSGAFFVAWNNPVDENNPDINSLTWKATSTGIYSVVLQNLTTQCSTKGEVEIIDPCDPNGIEVISKNNTITVSSSLSANSFVVNKRDNVVREYALINALGLTVKSAIESNLNVDFEISKDYLPTGIYNLLLYCNTQKVWVVKVVID